MHAPHTAPLVWISVLALWTILVFFVARMTVDAESVLDISHEAILRRVRAVELQRAEEQRSECPATDE